MKHKLRWPGAIVTLLSSFFLCIFLLTDRSLPVTSVQEMLSAMEGAQMGALCVILLGCLLFHGVFSLRIPGAGRLAALGSALFTLCEALGYHIYHYDSLLRPQTNLFSLALDFACLVGAFLLFYSLLMLIFRFVTTYTFSQATTPRGERWFGDNLRSFLLYFSIPFVICLGLQLFFHPGIITWDSYVMIEEGLGNRPLTDRNPFLLTLFMKVVIDLGTKLFGSLSGGIALFTLLQTLFVCLTTAFTMTYLARRRLHLGLRIGVFCYFVLHPAIACYSVTIWKDIWLSYFVLLYVLFLLEILTNPENFFRKKSHFVALALVILGFLFSKNTGIALFLVTAPFLLWKGRAHLKPLLCVVLLCLCLLGIVRFAVIPGFGIQSGSLGDPMSVPLQQIARTCVRAEDSLTPEQIAVISEILPYEDLPEYYDPTISDMVKMYFSEENFSHNPGRYIALWVELGKTHPRIYLESFLANSCGYWYPGVIYWQVTAGSPYPAETTLYGLRHYFVHLYEMLQTVPCISTLLSTALPFWACFVLYLICLLKKKKTLGLPLLVVLITWVLCIFSPVIAEYRYAFPAVLLLPVLTAFTLQDDLYPAESMGIRR